MGRNPFDHFPPKFEFPWEGKGPFHHWYLDNLIFKTPPAEPVNLITKKGDDK